MYQGKVFINGKLYLVEEISVVKCDDSIQKSGEIIKEMNDTLLSEKELSITDITNINNVRHVTKKEKQMILADINKDITNIFKSPKLNEIARKNPLIAHVDIFVEELDNIEKEIPSSCRYHFYENLETLDLETTPKIITDLKNKDTKSDKYLQSANYSVRRNTITLSFKSMQYFKKVIKVKKHQSTLKDYLRCELIHELMHMASSEMFLEEVKVGIISHDSQHSVLYEALNEGITELLSRRVYCNKDKVELSSYNVYVKLANQLSMLVGLDTIKKAYYGNESIENTIEKKLNTIADGWLVGLAHGVMCTIALVNPVDYSANQLNYIMNFQNYLLIYFGQQLKIHKEKGNYKEIVKIIDCIIQNFIYLHIDLKEDEYYIARIAQNRAMESYTEIINEYYEYKVRKRVRN